VVYEQKEHITPLPGEASCLLSLRSKPKAMIAASLLD